MYTKCMSYIKPLLSLEPFSRRPLGIESALQFAFLLVHKQAAGIAVSGITYFTDVRLFSGVRKDMVF